MYHYSHSVIQPALERLTAKIAELQLQSQEDISLCFVLSDMEPLKSLTIQSFALAIQSLFERSFRQYLISCAHELKWETKNIDKKLITGKWPDLQEAFLKLKGIDLRSFDSYKMLDCLQLLGNACRHGDGPSLETLAQKHPEFWIEPHQANPLPPLGFLRPEIPPQPKRKISDIALSEDHLHAFVNAIIWFWNDHEYIYINSISSKNPHISQTLAKMRKARANRSPCKPTNIV